MKSKQKIEFLDKIPEVNEGDIDSYKDFDALYKAYGEEISKVSTGGSYGKVIKISAYLLMMVGALYFLWLSSAEEVAKEEPQTKSAVEQETQAKTKSSVPGEKENDRKPEPAKVAAPGLQEEQTPDDGEPVADEAVGKPSRAHSAKNSDPVQISPTTAESSKNKADNKKASKQNSGEVSPSSSKTVVTKEKKALFVRAQPIDGFDSLYAYFRKNIVYPEQHRKDSIEGTTLVSFFVLSDSSISKVKIKESLGPGFDKEAIRIIENMPKWRPSIVNGQAVANQFFLPLKFELEGNSKIVNQ